MVNFCGLHRILTWVLELSIDGDRELIVSRMICIIYIFSRGFLLFVEVLKEIALTKMQRRRSQEKNGPNPKILLMMSQSFLANPLMPNLDLTYTISNFNLLWSFRIHNLLQSRTRLRVRINNATWHSHNYFVSFG